MARPKKENQKRETPIQFRPGSELAHRVRGFAESQGLNLPEACRLLLCLAIAEMDCRFAGLIRSLAEVMGDENAYVRACDHVHTALQAARRATNKSMQMDPERARFIEETVKVALKDRSAADRFRPLEFLPAEGTAAPEQPRGRPDLGGRRRKVRPINLEELDEVGQAINEPDPATEDQQLRSSSGG